MYDVFNEVFVKGYCCYLLIDGFLPDPVPLGPSGGINYLAPEVTAVSPTSLLYQEGLQVTVYGRYFGPLSVFDKNGVYQGPLGNIPKEEYERPAALVVMAGGAHARCLSTSHLSDEELVCTTPEMTALNVSMVVLVVRQQSQVWQRGSLVEVRYLPQYKYQCEVELSGRCFDCCEEECQFQFQENREIQDQALLVEGFAQFCKRECMEFCGFSNLPR